MAEYRYNGLGFRIGWHYDENGDKATDESDRWYYFCYDEDWRIVAGYWGSDASAHEGFVYHNAGLGGYGGSSYIDSVILRDRDAGDSSGLEERRYYCQNWRADVSAMLTQDGSMVEWVKYSPYGVPFSLPAGDIDSDGDWDATDSAAITGSYDVRKDVQLDGDVDAADITQANAVAGGYQALGRGVLSSTGVDNRKGYAGYEYDPTFGGAGRHLYHVRYRVYDADLGRWTTRDPLGYVRELTLYAYVRGSPLRLTDPSGLIAMSCGGCSGQPNTTPPPPAGSSECRSKVDDYIFWTFTVPRCRLETVNPDPPPPSPIPGIPPEILDPRPWKERLPYIEIRCKPPATGPDGTDCEQAARTAGYSCCVAGGTASGCIAAAAAAYQSCLNPPVVGTPPGLTPQILPEGFPPSIIRNPDTGQAYSCTEACDRMAEFYLEYVCPAIDAMGLEKGRCAGAARAAQVACYGCCFSKENTNAKQWAHCLQDFIDTMNGKDCRWPF